MTHASVFSGIGGPEVAATMLGWDNLFHCEINPFGRAVLDYWYPNAKSYDDITKTDFSEWRGKIDVLTGGFPCQPFSYAGQRRGAEDDRYLWPYMFKCIDAIRPTWVVAENVAGILTMVEQGQVSAMETQGSLFGEDNDIHRYRLRETFTLERICDDLERHGYAVQPVLIPACAVGAPHRRDRVFIVGRRVDAAYPDGTRARDNDRAAGDEGRTARQDRRESLRQGDGPTGTSGIEPASDDAQDPLRSRQLHGQHDQQGHQRDERHTGAGSGERLCNQTPGSAPTDPLISGARTPGASGSLESHGCHTHQQPCQWRTTPQWSDRFYAVLRHAADTDSHRGHQIHQHLQPQQPNGSVPLSNGRQRDAADTSREGLEGRDQSGRSERGEWLHLWRYLAGHGDEGSEEICGSRWLNFPTVSPVQIVSPVHRGNDGLPFNVDDLTLSPSKWRTEALKAYGNAIVPQVMYEIFRAIQITENQFKFNK